MATLLGTDTYQKQTSPNIVARPSGKVVTGNIVEISGVYTILGTEATNDVLPLFHVPVGAIVRDVWVTSDAVGGTSVVFTEFGDLGDTDRYSTTDIALTNAITESRWTLANAAAIAPFVVTPGAAQVVTGTITHSGAPTAGKKIYIRAQYRMP